MAKAGGSSAPQIRSIHPYDQQGATGNKKSRRAVGLDFVVGPRAGDDAERVLDVDAPGNLRMTAEFLDVPCAQRAQFVVTRMQYGLLWGVLLGCIRVTTNRSE